MAGLKSILVSLIRPRPGEEATLSPQGLPASASSAEADWAAIRKRYTNYPRETLSYATVRDYCDGADHLTSLLEFDSDLKDAQRPWIVKAILCRVPAGTRLIEIGGGVPRSSNAL